MYDRRIDNLTIQLGVSGMLWNNSLVMYDKQTNTLWSHILGRAMKGPLVGKRLRRIPCVMTDWQTWTAQHPDSTVLLLHHTAQDYRRDFYREPAKFVLGISEPWPTTAWGFDLLTATPVLQDILGKVPVVIVFQADNGTAQLLDRRLDDRVLDFELRNGEVVDQQTGSIWNGVTGEATAGELAGRRLRMLPALVSYRQTWQTFYPESRILPPTPPPAAGESQP